MGTLTARIATEIASYEGLVREAYKDGVGVWTWSIGITNNSGHTVYPRYKDDPQSLDECLAVFEWDLRTRYLPAVLDRFEGHDLSENEVGGALSFHYNTGAIATATWPKLWMGGDIEGAKASFMEWKHPESIIPRREAERDLFFDGTWSNKGTTTEYAVSKPSYTPDWSSAKAVPILDALEKVISENATG